MRVFACLAAILIGLVTAAVSPAPAFQAIENGIDFYGNDIGMVEVGPRDTAACSARCDADGRCRAFSLYTPPPGDKGFCWLKHTVGDRRRTTDVVSSLRASAPAPTSSAPAANGSRCRAAAEALAEGYSTAVDMAEMLLIMGPDNGATEQDMAGVRQSQAEQQAKLDRANAIISRFASAPDADAAIRQDIDRTVISALEAELAANCAGPTAAASAAPPTVWESVYMNPLEPLYVLAPDAPQAAFYRSLPRSAGNGRHEMWVVSALRGPSSDAGAPYDLGASLYAIDCNRRVTQVLRGRVYRNMVPGRDTPLEPESPLQQGSVQHQIIIQACDNPPLPAFAGSLAQVRQAVPLRTAAAPQPRPASRPAVPAPVTPADCDTSSTGCEYGIVAHMPGAAGQVGHQWISSGAWRNRIRLFDRSWGEFIRPVHVCGRPLYAGPDQMNKTVEGWLNPRREALATRFTLNSSDSDVEICGWGPGGRGGSLE